MAEFCLKCRNEMNTILQHLYCLKIQGIRTIIFFWKILIFFKKSIDIYKMMMYNIQCCCK